MNYKALIIARLMLNDMIKDLIFCLNKEKKYIMKFAC